MQKLTANSRYIVYVYIVYLVMACDFSLNFQVESDYDKLCKIFELIDQDQNSQTKNIIFLTNKVENDIPNIYELYRIAALVDNKDKYQFFKDSAQKTTKKQWDCIAMKSYYDR